LAFGPGAESFNPIGMRTPDGKENNATFSGNSLLFVGCFYMWGTFFTISLRAF
jgi:hypothetical protein